LVTIESSGSVRLTRFQRSPVPFTGYGKCSTAGCAGRGCAAIWNFGTLDCPLPLRSEVHEWSSSSSGYAHIFWLKGQKKSSLSRWPNSKRKYSRRLPAGMPDMRSVGITSIWCWIGVGRNWSVSLNQTVPLRGTMSISVPDSAMASLNSGKWLWMTWPP
jgi:hypothetical protein